MYSDRIAEMITFTSPKGNVFWAKFTTSDSTLSKRVGQFDYPGIDGTVVQDVGLKGRLWTIPVIFDEDDEVNADHDEVEEAFMLALAERGDDGRSIWTVDHPTKGTHYLQPIEFEEKVDTVGSDGAIEVSTKWLEPIAQDKAPTTSELAGGVSAQEIVLASSMADQVTENVTQDTLSQVMSVQNSTSAALAVVSGYVNSASSSVALILDSIASTASQAVDVASLAGQVFNLFQDPSLVLGTVESQVDNLGNILGSVLATAQDGDKNSAAIVEVFGTAVLIGAAEVLVNADFDDRTQLVQMIVALNALLASLTNGLDALQDQYTSSSLSGKYFSQSKSYVDTVALTAKTTEYLLSIFATTSATKTVTLPHGMATIAIALQEYKPRGAWKDSYFDEFLKQNRLHGTDIWFLPAGRSYRVTP